MLFHYLAAISRFSNEQLPEIWSLTLCMRYAIFLWLLLRFSIFGFQQVFYELGIISFIFYLPEALPEVPKSKMYVFYKICECLSQ